MVIKILRFKNGLDIVCKCEFYDDVVVIEDAMMFEVRGVNLAMQHWAPAAIIKENKTHVMADTVLCFFESTEDFVDYYSELISKMNNKLNELKNRDENNNSEELLKEIIEGTLKGSYVH